MASSTLLPTQPFLNEFTLFPQLPLELQRKIWRASLPGPRVVEVIYNHNLGTYSSTTAVPLALHVCHESRVEALRHYKLSFGKMIKYHGTDAENKTERVSDRRIYFDFEIDIFYPMPKLAYHASQILNMKPVPFKEVDIFSRMLDVTSDLGEWMTEGSNFKAFDPECEGYFCLTTSLRRGEKSVEIFKSGSGNGAAGISSAKGDAESFAKDEELIEGLLDIFGSWDANGVDPPDWAGITDLSEWQNTICRRTGLTWKLAHMRDV